MLYMFSVPLIDYKEFIVRVKDMPNMIYKTRKALKNDDWDKSYKDVFVLLSPLSTKVPKKEQAIISDVLITESKMEKDKKTRRRKEHFFHGAINFPR